MINQKYINQNGTVGKKENPHDCLYELEPKNTYTKYCIGPKWQNTDENQNPIK